ncbi:hypothetical protein BDZ94DRAFT_1266769 [Collybia nuda]|uniref:DNA replication regulator SLD2 n=1 Tax=Collybia nuda TaxID=64659 RepID=A0A9P6CFE5_9AGAR|nr:hypothetical protein BDZ94DRAFT_1266769 [Collybia nuda]
MTDQHSLSTVKAEIKEWERSFRSSNGKDPTIQDIRLQPHIADKYKLYKKLSKAVAQGVVQPILFTSVNANSASPSTPPRSRTRVSYSQPSSFLSKPRVAHTTAPLSTFNPFSPQKNKGKQREATFTPKEPLSNPFESPSKAKSKGPTPSRALSPDFFPILQLQRSSEFSNTPPRLSPVPTNAISRARKRLRGEPVSPSPNKEKRRRVGPQSALPFSIFAPDSSDDGYAEDDDVDMDTSFVTDSPVKLPTGGKSFKLLFEESSAPVNTGLLNGKVQISKSTTKPAALFRASTSNNGDGDIELGIMESSPGEGKSSPSSDKVLTVNKSPNRHRSKQTSARKSPQETSTKRPFPDTEMEVTDRKEENIGIQRTTLPSSLPLVHNSEDVTNRSLSTKTKDKAKVKPNIRRKKAKISESDDEDDDDESNIPVKIIHRSYTQQFKEPKEFAFEENDIDSDVHSMLNYIRRVPPTNTSIGTAVGLDNRDGTGRLEVDLPEKLRRVLALNTAEAKARESREEQVFKGLLYGQRWSHYDPVKGGDIWDAGEDDVRVDEEGVVRRDIEEEEDWEGEPVPWEVGEL